MLRCIPVLLLVLFLLPSVALAKKAPKEPKPLLLEPLVVEAKGEAAEVPSDVYKVLKAADRCLKSDRHWERGQENQIPVNQLYELLASSVVCWQGVEKKAEKLGSAVGASAQWIASRARYIECFRTFLWSIDAKQAGERSTVCRRLDTAMKEAAAALTASEGLAAAFVTPKAQALGTHSRAEIEGLADQIKAEVDNQGCG